jgi:peptidoglycan/LPS O-acetylase OafA/YrhL
VALELLRWVHPGTLTVLPALGFALAGSFLVVPLAWILHVTVEQPGRRAARGLGARLVQQAV